MSAGELLVEVRCEEIPARMLQPGVKQIGTRLFEELLERQLAPEQVETSFTPRRLVVVMTGIPAREPDREERVTGPPADVAYDDAGEPTAALKGFAMRLDVDASSLETSETDKGEYIVAIRQITGRQTVDLLSELLPEILVEVTWPRPMRWGEGLGPWARPIHSIVALYDGTVIPFELFGIPSGDETIGHPLSSPQPLRIESAAQYREALAGRGILVDAEARRQALAEALEAEAESVDGELVRDDELLDEVTALCEIPGVVRGSFGVVDLPREILVTSLRDHQSAFSIQRDGELLPEFVTVMDRADDPAGRVRRGNEWVVEARLQDARFFYREDRKRSLEERRGDLERLTFHERLGQYAAKVERIADLAAWLAEQLGESDLESSVRRAAALSKVDLTTEVVKEFTSLQGVMGGIYAREDGEGELVWRAIYDQYRPASTDDALPRDTVGQVVSLADRIDTLTGMFACGLVPTGSKDPFGLRRSAQGAVRIVLEADLEVDLELAATHALTLYGDRVDASPDEVLSTLRPFLLDRVRHLLGLAGYAYDEIEAAIGAGAGDLPDLARRVRALHEVRDRAGFRAVVLAAKRIANILRGVEVEEELVEERLVEPAEQALYQAARRLRSELDEVERSGDYASGLESIAQFAEVLDRFFVEVLVMDEDARLRTNRLALLQTIERTLSRFAHLTEMVVDKSEENEH